MEQFASCKIAIEECLREKRFAIAHLYSEERTMDMHIHDCYEIYFSISGGKQFLIGNKYYDIAPGDVFVINNYESHYVSQVDNSSYERIVISVSPDYLHKISSANTDLQECFINRNEKLCHRIMLDKDNQNRFMDLINKITAAEGFGADLMEDAAFMELMVLINGQYMLSNNIELAVKHQFNETVNQIIQFINKNISSKITISLIASEFYLSDAYICRLFKAETGTTINKYITARRISLAKASLASGCSVSEACEYSGFNDYTNFVQMFTKAVGMTPKKYSQNNKALKSGVAL